MKKMITHRIIIEIPDAEAQMLKTLQKKHKELRDLDLFLINTIRSRFGLS